MRRNGYCSALLCSSSKVDGRRLDNVANGRENSLARSGCKRLGQQHKKLWLLSSRANERIAANGWLLLVGESSNSIAYKSRLRRASKQEFRTTVDLDALNTDFTGEKSLPRCLNDRSEWEEDETWKSFFCRTQQQLILWNTTMSLCTSPLP